MSTDFDHPLLIVTTPSQLEETLRKVMKRIHHEPVTDFADQKMTIQQAANYIQVSYKTLCTWVNDGLIPVHGKGRKRFVIKDELVDNYKKMKS